MKWFKIEDQFLETNQAIQKIKVNGKSICLIQTDDKLFACATKCPHAGADISQGWLENQMIVCPFHRHQYHLENGRGAVGQGDYLPVYPLEKRADGYYIKLPYSWISKLLNI